MPVLDASVVVSWYVETDVNSDAADRWVVATRISGGSWNVPTIVLPEIAAALSRMSGGNAMADQAIRDFVQLDEVELFSVTEALARSAAAFAASLKIKGCDSIYVALAAELDDVLVTFDREQLTRAAGVIRVLQPS